jgi:hypothetical protein
MEQNDQHRDLFPQPPAALWCRKTTSQVSTACYLFSYPAFTVYFVEEVGHIILHEPPPFGTIAGVGNPSEFRREAGQVFRLVPLIVRKLLITVSNRTNQINTIVECGPILGPADEVTPSTVTKSLGTLSVF